MRHLVISVSILLIASFGIAAAFGAQKDSNTSVAVSKTPTQSTVKNTPQVKTADANSIGNVNAIAGEPNSPKEPNEIDKLKESFESVNVKKNSQKETQEWARNMAENRRTLAEIVQDQVAEELKFIRDIAVKERAVKTVDAIDVVLADRTERYAKIIEKAAKAKELIAERRAKEERKGPLTAEEKQRLREEKRKEREEKLQKSRPAQQNTTINTQEN